MSGQTPRDQLVTREEFSRLEAKVDQILGQAPGAQASNSSSTYATPTDPYEDYHQYVEIKDEDLSPETVFHHIYELVEKLEARLCDRLTKQSSEFHQEMKVVRQSIAKMEKRTTEIQKKIESHDEKMEKKTAEIQKTIESHDTAEIQKKIESRNEKMEKNLHDSPNQQTQNIKTHVDTKIIENTKQLKENMYQLKRELFAFTEKECQIIRDRIEGRLRSHKLYTLDFYVEDFRSLIKSGVCRHSPPWHINQFKSSIQGMVRFLNSGKMRVRMLYGRHPREVGLQPRYCGKLKVKATITDTSGLLPDMEVGEMTWDVCEECIKNNGDWGCFLGEINCQDIVDRGYAGLPDYINGAVLVRYVVEVLE